MRVLLCAECGKRKKPGERIIPASADGPAEYERVVFGMARQPLASQRVIDVVTDHVQRLTLPNDYHNCDACNREIRPGDRCCAHSACIASGVLAPWEDEYLVREVT